MSMPLPVLIDNVQQLADLVSGQTAFSIVLMRKFWPGGLTIIFKKAPQLHSLALAGSANIGVRIPDHPVARLLIRELGRPITGTSANLHTDKITLTADEVRDQLGSHVDYIIDAGRCTGKIESTIVDVTVNPPVIMRQGTIEENEIMAEYHDKGGS
jgi:L-threonylcarbamoyladenylate synthase